MNVFEIQELMEQVRKRSGNYCTFTISTSTDGEPFSTYISPGSESPPAPSHLKHESMQEVEARFSNYMVDCKTEVRESLEKDKARWEELIAEINEQLSALEET